MIKAILMLVFLTADGAQLVAVQPFESEAACVAELAKLTDKARAAIEPGRRYTLSCTVVQTAGVDS